MGLNKTDFGRVVVVDPGADKPILEVGTVRCCHCGKHWIPRPGSGIQRGWCLECNGPICGPDCQACVPVDLLLENYEKGRPLDFRPIVASVPRQITE